MIEYKIIEDTRKGEFVHKVNAALREGWSLYPHNLSVTFLPSGIGEYDTILYTREMTRIVNEEIKNE